jgi:hypothetical protein
MTRETTSRVAVLLSDWVGFESKQFRYGRSVAPRNNFRSLQKTCTLAEKIFRRFEGSACLHKQFPLFKRSTRLHKGSAAAANKEYPQGKPFFSAAP